MMRLREMDSKRTCVYLADTQGFPYGEKSQQEVIERALYTVSIAIRLFQPKTIVIACNTMSVAALSTLRKHFPLVPIVGTVPAIRLAAETTVNGRIGFLATDATVASSYSQDLKRNYASDCKIFPLGSPQLVTFVERHIADATESEKENAVKSAVEYFANRDCDTVILGCTHFTHLFNTFEKVFSAVRSNTRVVDSRGGVARRALEVCGVKGDGEERGEDKEKDGCVFVTGRGEGEEGIAWKKICDKYCLKWMGSVQ